MSIAELFADDLNVVNVGLDMFGDDIAQQGVAVTTLDWTPPGGGKPEIIAALTGLEEPLIAASDRRRQPEAVERITSPSRCSSASARRSTSCPA